MATTPHEIILSTSNMLFFTQNLFAHDITHDAHPGKLGKLRGPAAIGTSPPDIQKHYSESKFGGSKKYKGGASDDVSSELYLANLKSILIDMNDTIPNNLFMAANRTRQATSSYDFENSLIVIIDIDDIIKNYKKSRYFLFSQNKLFDANGSVNPDLDIDYPSNIYINGKLFDAFNIDVNVGTSGGMGMGNLYTISMATTYIDEDTNMSQTEAYTINFYKDNYDKDKSFNLTVQTSEGVTQYAYKQLSPSDLYTYLDTNQDSVYIKQIADWADLQTLYTINPDEYHDGLFIKFIDYYTDPSMLFYKLFNEFIQSLFTYIVDPMNDIQLKNIIDNFVKVAIYISQLYSTLFTLKQGDLNLNEPFLGIVGTIVSAFINNHVAASMSVESMKQFTDSVSVYYQNNINLQRIQSLQSQNNATLEYFIKLDIVLQSLILNLNITNEALKGGSNYKIGGTSGGATDYTYQSFFIDNNIVKNILSISSTDTYNSMMSVIFPWQTDVGPMNFRSWVQTAGNPSNILSFVKSVKIPDIPNIQEAMSNTKSFATSYINSLDTSLYYFFTGLDINGDNDVPYEGLINELGIILDGIQNDNIVSFTQLYTRLTQLSATDFTYPMLMKSAPKSRIHEKSKEMTKYKNNLNIFANFEQSVAIALRILFIVVQLLNFQNDIFVQSQLSNFIFTCNQMFRTYVTLFKYIYDVMSSEPTLLPAQKISMSSMIASSITSINYSIDALVAKYLVPQQKYLETSLIKNQRNILNKIILKKNILKGTTGGSDIDTTLEKFFMNYLIYEAGNFQGNSNYLEGVLKGGSKRIQNGGDTNLFRTLGYSTGIPPENQYYVINNAVTGLNKFNIPPFFCPFSSIVDGQSTCRTLKSAMANNGIEIGNMNVIIRDGRSDIKSSVGPTGETTRYHIRTEIQGQNLYIHAYLKIGDDILINVGQVGSYVNQEEPEIIVDLNSTNTPLSAVNVIKDMMMTNYELMKDATGNTVSWSSYLKSIEQVANINIRRRIITSSFKKSLGDYLQELNAIVSNGGYVGKLEEKAIPKTRILDPNTLRVGLHNDRPAMIRAILLILLGKGDVNPNALSGLLTIEGRYVVGWRNKKGNNSLLGGNKRRYTKKHKQKQKQKQKQNKHIIYKKNKTNKYTNKNKVTSKKHKSKLTRRIKRRMTLRKK